MMLVGEDELEEARVGVGLVSRQRVPDLESNLLMNLLDKTLNQQLDVGINRSELLPSAGEVVVAFQGLVGSVHYTDTNC
jgi:hypothetical protein